MIQSPNILPSKAFNMQIEILDADASEKTNRTIGNQDLITDELRPVPVVEPLLPVKSYDAAIYSELGDILWHQNDTNPTGGRRFEIVILEDPYEGGITISITDIRSPQNSSIDSVQFPARLG